MRKTLLTTLAMLLLLPTLATAQTEEPVDEQSWGYISSDFDAQVLTINDELLAYFQDGDSTAWGRASQAVEEGLDRLADDVVQSCFADWHRWATAQTELTALFIRSLNIGDPETAGHAAGGVLAAGILTNEARARADEDCV